MGWTSGPTALPICDIFYAVFKKKGWL